jgi:hypothetical protein
MHIAVRSDTEHDDVQAMVCVTLHSRELSVERFANRISWASAAGKANESSPVPSSEIAVRFIVQR